MVPSESIIEQVAFFERAHDTFRRAAASSGETTVFIRACGTKICLRFAGSALAPLLTPAFTHLRTSPDTAPDLTVCLWDSHSTGTEMAPPPWNRDRYTSRGEIWGFNGSRFKTAFNWVEYSLNLLDLDSGTGLFWVEHPLHIPFAGTASPLRALLHWWAEKNDAQMVHAAAVGTERGAVLLTGRGGAGKSTTALACLDAGFRYLGDDYVVIGLTPEPRVFSLYGTAKLDAEAVRRLPGLSSSISGPSPSGDEKAVLFLSDLFASQLVDAMPLRAVIVPRITEGRDSRLVPAAPEQVLRAASFTTMSQLPGANVKTYDTLGRLSACLPCFTLELGSDLTQIPGVLSGLLESLHGASHVILEANAGKAPEPEPTRWPLVSVIVPVYNGERFLAEAVESILAQEYPSLDVVIVDDGSTDGTEEAVRTLPLEVRYVRQGHSGPASARNKGIREAAGDLLAFLDVDDLWPKGTLFRHVESLLREKDADVVRGYAQMADFNPQSGFYEYVGNPLESFSSYIGAALYRRSAFQKVGMFDAKLLYGEDSDWSRRGGEVGLRVKMQEDVTLVVRRHDQNMTRGKTLVELGMLRVLKKSVDRIRGGSRG